MQHYWAPLVQTSSERIDIDTASISVITPNVRRVWLRWDLNAGVGATFGPGYQPQYDLELRDVDCSSNRTRTIERRHVAPVGATGAGESLSATEASWQTPIHDSLLAQVLDAACRFTKAGA
jgi:hypothetical protein